MSAGERYVAAAYLVVFLFVLAYVLIMAAKLSRLRRDVSELTELARRRREREAWTTRSAVWTSQPTRTPQVAKRPAIPGRRASPTKATAASP